MQTTTNKGNLDQIYMYKIASSFNSPFSKMLSVGIALSFQTSKHCNNFCPVLQFQESKYHFMVSQ